MNYKKNRKLIRGDIENKKLYCRLHNKCEVCHSKYWLQLHHHLKQQKQWIEDFDNYSVLCCECHDKLHTPLNQFVREVKTHPKSKLRHLSIEEVREYLLKLKD